ncbi:hypothetical protein FB45DRAFT_933863 [Roridomyces roridus]|uniref:F-box domain-containing protein n=1 Tax=Roridomyces roridus TaxID=1738132 RepID=A0AAD7FFQ3_9AGAR|nr:hypothetical protein FB45DRAFT_933863 [Roridomyces roridus]
MRISDVPLEILCRILVLSDPQTILRCSSVSSTWHDAIAGCLELQYQVELWKAGLVCGLPSSMSMADKLQALAKHRRAWQELDWTSKTEFDLPSSREHELVAGIFAFREDFGPPLIDVDPGTLETVTLAMDPTQDLLAVVYSPAPGSDSFTLILRSLSAENPHPMARHPTITIEADNVVLGPRTIQIAHDVVGISFGILGVIRIWNWHTGVLLADVARLDTRLPDFRFLSPRAFVTASPTESGWIDIFMITPTKAPDHAGAVHVVRLRFPELARVDGMSLWDSQAIDISGGPVCGHPIRGSFSPRTENGIYLFMHEVHSLNHERQSRWLRLMIHHRTLADYISRYLQADQTECIDLQWEAWGPRNTRILPGDPLDWIAATHGERIAIRGVEQLQVQVFDFGIFPGDPANDKSEDDALVLGPTTIGAPFNDPVTTYLPFRRTSLETRDFNRIFMDQEHLIVAEDFEEDFEMTIFKFPCTV